MKGLFLCLLLACNTVFAFDFDSLELNKLPVGSSISFKKLFIIEAGDTNNYLGDCEMSYKSSKQNRQLTTEHTLVLTKAHVSKNTQDVAVDCQYGEDENFCNHESRNVADYELVFDVYKAGVRSSSSPITISCTDDSGHAFDSIKEFSQMVEAQEMSLTIKNDAVDF